MNQDLRKTRMDYDMRRRQSWLERLGEIAREDVVVSHFLKQWEQGNAHSLEHVLFELAIQLAEQKAEYFKAAMKSADAVTTMKIDISAPPLTGLFISTGNNVKGVDKNPGIILFSSEDDAYKHAVELLVANDELFSDGDIVVDGGGTLFKDNKEALQSWQDGLGASEYFHVYPCEYDQMMKFFKELDEEGCTCHERDSSVTCDFCKAQGYYGHMEVKPDAQDNSK